MVDMSSTSATAEPFDYLILGQGIAGSTLAWHLTWQGAKVAVIDAGKPTTASRLAAGLLTPITGKRLTASERWDELFPVAKAFYQRVESEAGTKLFHQKPSLRLFASEEERQRFSLRCEEKCFADRVRLIEQPPVGMKGPYGGFEMLEAARLDTAVYLEATREMLQTQNGFFVAEIDPNKEVVLKEKRVTISRLGIQSHRIIFCQGAAAVMPTWQTDLRLKPSLGEVLTIDLAIELKQTVHRGIWLSPEAPERYRLGATNRWEAFEELTTEAGKQELLTKLSGMTDQEPKLVSQQAAIRPTTVDRKVSFGWHRKEPRLGWLNGLGTKGSLWAPWSASQLLKNTPNNY